MSSHSLVVWTGLTVAPSSRGDRPEPAGLEAIEGAHRTFTNPLLTNVAPRIPGICSGFFQRHTCSWGWQWRNCHAERLQDQQDIEDQHQRSAKQRCYVS